MMNVWPWAITCQKVERSGSIFKTRRLAGQLRKTLIYPIVWHKYVNPQHQEEL